MRAEGFFSSLDVLYGGQSHGNGLGISVHVLISTKAENTKYAGRFGKVSTNKFKNILTKIY